MDKAATAQIMADQLGALDGTLRTLRRLLDALNMWRPPHPQAFDLSEQINRLGEQREELERVRGALDAETSDWRAVGTAVAALAADAEQAFDDDNRVVQVLQGGTRLIAAIDQVLRPVGAGPARVRASET